MEELVPIKFSFPRTVIDSVQLVFDSGLTIDSIVLPANLEYSSALGNWTISSSITKFGAQNEILLTLANTLDEIVVPADQFEELKKFCAIMESRDKRLVKVYLK